MAYKANLAIKQEIYKFCEKYGFDKRNDDNLDAMMLEIITILVLRNEFERYIDPDKFTKHECVDNSGDVILAGYFTLDEYYDINQLGLNIKLR